MTDPLIEQALDQALEQARRVGAMLGPSMALRTARPAPGYETTSRQPAAPDAAMLARHEHLTRQRAASSALPEPAELALRRRQLELRRRQLELARLAGS